MGLFSSKKTTNVTENKTDVTNNDNRVAAADSGIALGGGSSLDQSVYFNDQSTTLNEQLSDDVALGAIMASAQLGQGAFGLVAQGLVAQADAARENRLLAGSAFGTVADVARHSLDSTLSLLDADNSRVMQLARDVSAAGQSESSAARIGAQETIKEVLGFKEASDTKVAETLIKWGAVALGLLALVFIFRPRRAS